MLNGRLDAKPDGTRIALPPTSVCVPVFSPASLLVAQSNETGSDITGLHLHYDHNTGAIATGATKGSGSYVNPKLEFANCEEADD